MPPPVFSPAETPDDAMRQSGVDYEHFLFQAEGHGFAKPENNLKFHAAAEAFLAKYLGERH